MEVNGEVQLNWSRGYYVECHSDENCSVSTFLAASIADNDVLTLTLDCAISLRNLLPSDCMWEIADSDLNVIESSSPAQGLGDQIEHLLRSGNRAEIFSGGHEMMHLRCNLPSVPAWSTWTSLSTSVDLDMPKRTENVESLGPVQVTRETTIIDPFGVPLVLGVRIGQKPSGGIDVILYAELWLSNCTSLSLVFGYIKENSSSPHTQGSFDPSLSELSAAEAALKEISSLFELGDEGKGITRDQRSQSLGAVDIYRLPGQRVDAIIEECFEYIEVESSAVKRRWWGSENSGALRENLTEVESDGRNWRWLDKSWVGVLSLLINGLVHLVLTLGADI
jgi:hypothetical protein